MSAREFFNNNPAIVTAGAVVVLVLCLGAIAYNLFGGLGGSGSGSVKILYFDVSSNTIKLVSSKDRPGSPLADNDQAFRCVIMSCGECGEITEGMTNDELRANDMFVAYLMTTPESMRMEPGMQDDSQIGTLTESGVAWLPMSSPEGSTLMRDRSNYTCEDNTAARQCQP